MVAQYNFLQIINKWQIALFRLEDIRVVWSYNKIKLHLEGIIYVEDPLDHILFGINTIVDQIMGMDI